MDTTPPINPAYEEIPMRHFLNQGFIALLVLTAAGSAIAQETAMAPATVTLTASIRQYTLSEQAETDTFKVSIVDAQAKQNFTQTCSPGKSGMMAAISNWFRKDEACAVSQGAWFVINPANKAEVKVGDIIGSFTISGERDGYTPMNTLILDPTRGSGRVAANGNVIMKPEDPSAELMAEAAKLADSFKGADVISTTETTDSIYFRDFGLPASGFPKEPACTTDGEAIYIYDRGLWRMDLTITCGAESYRLAGDMTWVDVDGETDHTAIYQLDLQVPTADVDIFAEYDPFAEVDGVKATIKMNGSDAVEVAVTDTFSYEVDQKIDVNGTFVGTNVSLPAVRTIAQLIGYFPRLNFGA